MRYPQHPGASAEVNAPSVEDWTRLRRFLVLGSEAASYFASTPTLTAESATAVERCVRANGPRAVAEIVPVSAPAGRRRATRPCSAWRWRPASAMPRRAAPRWTRCRASPGRARTCSSSRRSSRASAAGGARCAARWPLVRGPAGRRARPAGGRAPPARGHRAPRPPAPGPPRPARVRRQPVRRADGGPRAPVRLDRPGRLERRPAPHGRGVRPRAGRADARRDGAARRRVPPAARGGPARAPHAPDVWAALLADMPLTALVRNLARMTRARRGVRAQRGQAGDHRHRQAAKRQVQDALARIHGLREVPTQPDAADAVAVGLTHLLASRMRGIAARAGVR